MARLLGLNPVQPTHKIFERFDGSFPPIAGLPLETNGNRELQNRILSLVESADWNCLPSSQLGEPNPQKRCSRYHEFFDPANDRCLCA